MNELSQIIFFLLSLVVWAVIWILFLAWFINYFLPNNKWLKRRLKTTAHFVLLEPIKTVFRVILWLIVRVFTTRPEYRLHQIHLENYPLTPLEFYAAVEEIFRQRQIIGAEVSRLTRREWHLLSARRIYLLFRFREAICFIGAVPLGTGFLVSWRYSALPGRIFLILFQIPYFGVIAEQIIKPSTFYRTDLYYAFEQAVRSTILEATDLLAEQGLRPLTENEQRPLLPEFYR